MLYAIGDIHGRFDLLTELHEKIMKDSEQYDNNTVVFLGDYVDRGPESKQVVDFLRQEPFENFEHVFLKGNHEQMMLDALAQPGVDRQMWMQNGGHETLVSYGIAGFFDPNYREACRDTEAFFRSRCKTYHLKGNFLFVHAGINPDFPVTQQKENTFLWIRDKFLYYEGKFFMNENNHHPVFVVHGHTPVWDGKVEIKHNRANIDTGAVWTDVLSAIKIKDNKIVGTIQT